MSAIREEEDLIKDLDNWNEKRKGQFNQHRPPRSRDVMAEKYQKFISNADEKV